MIVVAVLNQKGGSGKTTLSTCIARALFLEDRSVCLVDSDPQGSARDWHAAGDGELLTVGLDRPTLHKDLVGFKSGYDWIIVDGAPQLQDMAVSALKAADVVLIPVQPSPYDVWACADLVDLIKTRQEVTGGIPKAAFVISRAIEGTIISRDVDLALKEHELPVLQARTHQRVIFANSATDGRTPIDVDPKSKASDEIRALVSELKTFARLEGLGYASVIR